ncbi:MAG: hypothetical protein V3V08_08705, partial [Nannocystaceae bacterium]
MSSSPTRPAPPIWAQMLGILVVILIVHYTFSPQVRAQGWDREIYRYLGMRIATGGYPYSDGFYDKPPLIYLIAALGHGFGPWGIWLLESIAMLVACCALLLFLRARSVPFAFLHATALIVLMRTVPELWKDGGRYGDTRSFAVPLLVGTVICLYSRGRPRYRLAGVMIGAMAMLQQELALPVVGVVAPAWFHAHAKLRSARWVGEGLLVVPTLILIWLWAGGALGDYVDQTYFYALEYHLPSPKHPATTASLFSELRRFELLLPTVLAVSAAAFLLRARTSASLTLACLAALLLQLVAIRLTGRYMWDYFLP